MPSEVNMRLIGESIRQRRIEAGYRSVSELCEKLDGMNPKRYYAYEQGKSVMSLQTAVEVADAIGCTVDELVGRGINSERAAMARDEAQLLDAYEACNPVVKQALLTLAMASMEEVLNGE